MCKRRALRVDLARWRCTSGANRRDVVQDHRDGRAAVEIDFPR